MMMSFKESKRLLQVVVSNVVHIFADWEVQQDLVKRNNDDWNSFQKIDLFHD